MKKMVTGKPSFASKSDSKSSVNSKWFGQPLNPGMPSGGGGFGMSSNQSSGKTIHGRKTGVNLAGKGENLKNMPTVHN
jgi:hypothetical protein